MSKYTITLIDAVDTPSRQQMPEEGKRPDQQMPNIGDWSMQQLSPTCYRFTAASEDRKG